MKCLVRWLIEWPQQVAEYLSWLAPLFARITVGRVFLWRGWDKLHNLPQVTENFISWAIPFPRVLTPFLSGVEFFGGLFLLLGFLTRISAGALGITMIVAIRSAPVARHRRGRPAVSGRMARAAHETTLPAGDVSLAAVTAVCEVHGRRQLRVAFEVYASACSARARMARHQRTQRLRQRYDRARQHAPLSRPCWPPHCAPIAVVELLRKASREVPMASSRVLGRVRQRRIRERGLFAVPAPSAVTF